MMTKQTPHIENIDTKQNMYMYLMPLAPIAKLSAWRIYLKRMMFESNEHTHKTENSLSVKLFWSD